jgi:hypothetical protein
MQAFHENILSLEKPVQPIDYSNTDNVNVISPSRVSQLRRYLSSRRQPRRTTPTATKQDVRQPNWATPIQEQGAVRLDEVR